MNQNRPQSLPIANSDRPKSLISKILDHEYATSNKIFSYTNVNDEKNIIRTTHRTDMADIINPIKCKRNYLKSRGLKPHNHITDQFKHIKKLQLINSEKQKPSQIKERFILNKYKNIESKVVIAFNQNQNSHGKESNELLLENNEKDIIDKYNSNKVNSNLEKSDNKNNETTEIESEFENKNNKLNSKNSKKFSSNFISINVNNVLNKSNDLSLNKISKEKLEKFNKETYAPNSSKCISFGKIPK